MLWCPVWVNWSYIRLCLALNWYHLNDELNLLYFKRKNNDVKLYNAFSDWWKKLWNFNFNWSFKLLMNKFINVCLDFFNFITPMRIKKIMITDTRDTLIISSSLWYNLRFLRELVYHNSCWQFKKCHSHKRDSAVLSYYNDSAL